MRRSRRRPVAAAMGHATSSSRRRFSRSPTPGAQAASEAGVRIGTLPGVTEEMLARVMSADMEGLRLKGRALADILTNGTEAHITCPQGSDLRLGLEGRKGISDAGELTEPGAFGNLPCGEAFIAPLRHRRGRRSSSPARSPVSARFHPVTWRSPAATSSTPPGRRGRSYRAADRAAGRHQRRRARDRHQREGDAHRRDPRGREDPRHGPRRVRRLGAGSAERSRSRSISTVVVLDPMCDRRRAVVAAGCSWPELRCSPFPTSPRAGTPIDAAPRGRLRLAAPQLLDRHSDPDHNRTVFTPGRRPGPLRDALVSGAAAALERIDMSRHQGLHPGVGALDVCPVVWLDRGGSRCGARRGRWRSPRRSASLGVPVFFYGALASAPERARARLFPPRRAGRAAGSGWSAVSWRPTAARICRTRRAGATLVTARPPLAAFNVELDTGDVDIARSVAAGLRESGGGLPGVRAIGLVASRRAAQVSTNIHDPLAVPLGAGGGARRGSWPRRSARGRLRPSWSGLCPRVGDPRPIPRDVPMRGFDPRPPCDRAAARRRPERLGPLDSRAMAQTKKRRRRKHRGTQGGRVDPQPPAGPPTHPRGGPGAGAREAANRPGLDSAADLAQRDDPRRDRGGVFVVCSLSDLQATRSGGASASAPSCSSSTSRRATTSIR